VSQNNGHWSFRKCFAALHFLQELQHKIGSFLAGNKNLLVIEEGVACTGAYSSIKKIMYTFVVATDAS
jgi:hypothetical protein